MIIPQNIFIYINIAVFLIYLIFAVVSYKNGFLLQALSLVYTVISLFVAWFTAPILAARIPLVKLEETYDAFDLSPLINSLIYCIIVFLLMRLIYLFIAPLFKSLSKVPVLGILNRLAGLLLGLINATIVIMLLSMLLNTPFIKNGKEVKEATVFKYTDKLTAYAVDLTVNRLNLDAIKETVDGFDVDVAREKFTTWLIDQGIIDE